jgi:hypothetical protein
LVAVFYFVAAIVQWSDRFGFWRTGLELVAGVLAAAFVAVLLGANDRWRRWLIPVVVIFLMVDVVGVFRVPGSATSQGTASTSTTSSASSPPPSPSSTPDPTVDNCGKSASASVEVPRVQICVVYWCTGEVRLAMTGEVDPTQLQYKIRPRINNNSDQPINIALTPPTPLRLIVDSPALPVGWHPPPATAAAGDSVLRVSWNGKTFWAVPPNVNQDVSLVGGYWTGFTTLWDGDQIDSNGTYFKHLRLQEDGTNKQEGDLVFQLPKNPDGSDPTVIGLAYVDVTPGVPLSGENMHSRDKWPVSSQPTTF